MAGRCNEQELLDDLAVKPEDLLVSLNFMRQVNALFGGRRVILDYFRRQDLPDTFTVLDIGCGGGDLPFALTKWARSRGKRALITAIDLQPLCLTYASHRFASPDIQYREHSAFEIEALGRFDFVTSSMFFHHLNDGQITDLLRKMENLSDRGWIVNDLYRGALNYAGAWLLGLSSGRAIVFNDAKLSVARAFRETDFLHYREEAGLFDAKIERRPVFRITLSHAKRSH